MEKKLQSREQIIARGYMFTGRNTSCKQVVFSAHINRLKMNIDKTEVMLIGSNDKLRSLNVEGFILSYDDTSLVLVEDAKYLVVFINCDISWDFHVRRFCQSIYFHISLLRKLCRIFPFNLLLQVYISYI